MRHRACFKIKKGAILAWFLAVVLLLTGCSGKKSSHTQQSPQQPVTILVAAASSLETVLETNLIPLFQQQYSWIQVEGSYDSSGKLQTQIREGMEADLFLSASTKQMDELVLEKRIDRETVVPVIYNKLVLIRPSYRQSKVTRFADAANAATIALGDPASVPAGQYAKEAFTALGIWDTVAAKASYGTNVTEVLNWVAQGSADLGVVYASDAASNQDVTIIAQAPEGSLAKAIVYPGGVTTNGLHPEEAALFLTFLRSEMAAALLEAYGFTPYE